LLKLQECGELLRWSHRAPNRELLLFGSERRVVGLRAGVTHEIKLLV
jgi:hypothetical protein